MLESLWPSWLDITKKKKCMFGKDEESRRSPHLHAADTGSWITTSVTVDNDGGTTTGAWVHYAPWVPND